MLGRAWSEQVRVRGPPAAIKKTRSTESVTFIKGGPAEGRYGEPSRAQSMVKTVASVKEKTKWVKKGVFSCFSACCAKSVLRPKLGSPKKELRFLMEFDTFFCDHEICRARPPPTVSKTIVFTVVISENY